MAQAIFADSLGGKVEIDICWPCHLIWFDHLESTSLSAKSVIELFRLLNTHKDDNRNQVSMNTRCPRCHDGLKLTNDVTRSGKFSYQRCPQSHGRLISFTQFLREKNFIRTLNAAEIQSLAATVKEVRCSSCGAPVNIEKDHACTHCGAPIAVLDEAAVAKALADYDRRVPTPLPVAAMTAGVAGATIVSAQTTDQHWAVDAGAGMLGDLVLSGLAAVIESVFD